MRHEYKLNNRTEFESFLFLFIQIWHKKKKILIAFLPQMERYKELKELAQRQGAILSQQADKLHWDVKADYEQIAVVRRRKKEVEVQKVIHLKILSESNCRLQKDCKPLCYQAAIRSHKTQLEDLTSRAEKLEEYTKTCRLVMSCSGRKGCVV